MEETTERRLPDFEGFTRELMEKSLEGGYIDELEAEDLIDLIKLAVKHGVLRAEEYDPERHGEADSCAEGDTLYVPWFWQPEAKDE